MSKPTDVLVEKPPGERIEACVTVPAKDEEDLLPSALRALAEQKTIMGDPLDHERYEVILLINNTRDRSRHVAEQFRRLYPTFNLHIVERNFNSADSHNGYVRRLLMDEACRRLETRVGSGNAILTTDADSQVASNWISRNQEEFSNGAEAVAGRIVILPAEEAFLHPTTRAIQRYDHLYRRLVAWIENRLDPQPDDPWPRHHQHFGASLAITPSTYKSVGRIPPRRHFEDIMFYQVLIRHDVRLRHSNRVRVFTSARLTGRARFGMSSELSDWQACGTKGLRVRVECAEFLEYLFIVRRRLRLLWLEYRNNGAPQMDRVRHLSRDTGIVFPELLAHLRSARYFGVLIENTRFYEMCRKQWPDHLRLKPMKSVVDHVWAAFIKQAHVAARAHQFDTALCVSPGGISIRNGSGNSRVHHHHVAENQPGTGASELAISGQAVQPGR